MVRADRTTYLIKRQNQTVSGANVFQNKRFFFVTWPELRIVGLVKNGRTERDLVGFLVCVWVLFSFFFNQVWTCFTKIKLLPYKWSLAARWEQQRCLSLLSSCFNRQHFDGPQLPGSVTLLSGFVGFQPPLNTGPISRIVVPIRHCTDTTREVARCKKTNNNRKKKKLG